MAQVNIVIAGKTYRMACDDGQEAHLTALGERLARTIEQLRERFGEIGDQRLTVMAAITMADQYSEAERRLRDAEDELSSAGETRAAIGQRQAAVEAEVARSLEAAATRLELLAERLNGASSGGEG
jgi:cell division protein ZapA